MLLPFCKNGQGGVIVCDVDIDDFHHLDSDTITVFDTVVSNMLFGAVDFSFQLSPVPHQMCVLRFSNSYCHALQSLSCISVPLH